MQAAEFVDAVLVFSSDFYLFAGCDLVLFCELCAVSDEHVWEGMEYGWGEVPFVSGEMPFWFNLCLLHETYG